MNTKLRFIERKSLHVAHRGVRYFVQNHSERSYVCAAMGSLSTRCSIYALRVQSIQHLGRGLPAHVKKSIHHQKPAPSIPERHVALSMLFPNSCLSPPIMVFLHSHLSVASVATSTARLARIRGIVPVTHHVVPTVRTRRSVRRRAAVQGERRTRRIPTIHL